MSNNPSSNSKKSKRALDPACMIYGIQKKHLLDDPLKEAMHEVLIGANSGRLEKLLAMMLSPDVDADDVGLRLAYIVERVLICRKAMGVQV